jgi:integrase
MHGLRHSFVALAISQGVHVKDISEQLGHAKISTTMDIYGHVLQVTKRETADKINAVIRSVKVK